MDATQSVQYEWVSGEFYTMIKWVDQNASLQFNALNVLIPFQSLPFFSASLQDLSITLVST